MPLLERTELIDDLRRGLSRDDRRRRQPSGCVEAEPPQGLETDDSRPVTRDG